MIQAYWAYLRHSASMTLSITSLSGIMMSVIMPNVIMLSVMAPYNKPCFETAYIGENVINLLKQYVAISLFLWATSSFQKIITSLQK